MEKEVAAFLENDGWSMRNAMTWALHRIGEKGTANFAPKVAALITADGGSARGTAVELLGLMGHEGAVFSQEVAALLDDHDVNVRRRAVTALGDMGSDAAANAPEVAVLLEDLETVIRGKAAETLGRMGKAGAPFAKEVAALLGDPEVSVRTAAAATLDQWGNPTGEMNLQAILLAAADKTPAKELPALRAHLRLWAGGNAAMQRSVTWLGKPESDPIPREGLSGDETRETLAMFLGLWEHTEASAALREELAHRIGQVAKAISAKPDAATAAMLTELAAKLKGQPAFAGEYEAVSGARAR